jgi:hypothetical protein
MAKKLTKKELGILGDAYQRSFDELKQKINEMYQLNKWESLRISLFIKDMGLDDKKVIKSLQYTAGREQTTKHLKQIVVEIGEIENIDSILWRIDSDNMPKVIKELQSGNLRLSSDKVIFIITYKDGKDIRENIERYVSDRKKQIIKYLTMYAED